MGVVSSNYTPLIVRFDHFKAPLSGRYKLRLNAFSFWAGPRSGKQWWLPDRANVSRGRTREPVTIYSETPPKLLRKLGTIEVSSRACRV